MTNYFSDHYTETGLEQSAVNRNWKAPVGIAHSRLRYKVAGCTNLPLTTEEVRFMTFKSTDRLIDMLVTSGGLAGAGDILFGLYYSGLNHDGAVVDADLFAPAVTTSTAVARVDHFTDGVLTNFHRGQMLWEQAVVGAAIWTADPGGTFDLVGTVGTTFTTPAEVHQIEVHYLAGD